MNDYLLIIRNRGSTTKLKRIEAINYIQALNKACSLYPNKFINYKHIIRRMDLLSAQKEAASKSAKSAHKQHIVLLPDGDFEVENDLSLEKGMDVYMTYHKGKRVESTAVAKASNKMEPGAIEKAVKNNTQPEVKNEVKTQNKKEVKKETKKPAPAKKVKVAAKKETSEVEHPRFRPINGGAALEILNVLKKRSATKNELAKAAKTKEGNIPWYIGKIRNNKFNVIINEYGKYQLVK